MPDTQPSLGQQLLSGSVWAFLAKVVGIGAALTVNALLARMLAPEEFGTYILAGSVVVVSSIVASLGMNNVIVRLLGESHSVDRGEFSRAIILRCSTIALCGAVVAAGFLAGPPGRWLAERVFSSELLTNCMAWIAVWLIALTAQSILAEAHRGLKDIRMAAILGGPVAGIGLVMILLASLVLGVELELKSAILLSAISALLVVPLGIWFVGKNTVASSGQFHLKPLQLASIAGPMLITNITLAALNQSDIWIVGICLEKTDVALYGSAVQLASLIGFPLLILNSVVPPYVAELYKLDQHDQLQRELRRAAGIATYAAVAGFFIVALLSAQLLRIVYGDFYQQAATVLVIIALGRLASVCTGPCGIVLMMTGFHQVMMWVNILAGAMSVLLMVLVARPFGLQGIATVAAVMIIAQNAAMLWLARSKSGVWTHAELSPKAILFA